MNVVAHDNVGKGHTMWWCGQYIVRCGGQYTEEQPPLYEGILESPRKATLRSINWGAHQITQKVLHVLGRIASQAIWP